MSQAARSENRLPRLRCQCGARRRAAHGQTGGGHAQCVDSGRVLGSQYPAAQQSGDALNALKQHEAALLRGYPMALLEIFAEGPANAKVRPADASGMDFGELSLMDDSEVQDQVELARAQQLAPMRPRAYCQNSIRWSALRRVCAACSPSATPCVPKLHPRIAAGCGETGATSEVRQLWMQHMRGLLGKLLEGEYQRMAKMLRETRACSLWDTRCWALPAVRWADQATALWPAPGHGLRRWLCHGLRAHQRMRWGFRVQQPWHGCAYRVAGRFPAVPWRQRRRKPF